MFGASTPREAQSTAEGHHGAQTASAVSGTIGVQSKIGKSVSRSRHRIRHVYIAQMTSQTTAFAIAPLTALVTV